MPNGHTRKSSPAMALMTLVGFTVVGAAAYLAGMHTNAPSPLADAGIGGKAQAEGKEAPSPSPRVELSLRELESGGEVAEDEREAVTERFEAMWPDVEIESVARSLAGDYFRIEHADGYFYLHESEPVGFSGDLFDFERHINLTAMAREMRSTIKEIERLSESPGEIPGERGERSEAAAGASLNQMREQLAANSAAAPGGGGAGGRADSESLQQMRERLLNRIRRNTGFDAPSLSGGGSTGEAGGSGGSGAAGASGGTGGTPTAPPTGATEAGGGPMTGESAGEGMRLGSWYVQSSAEGDRIPKVGYNEDGERVSEGQRRARIESMVERIPDNWTVNYEARGEEALEVLVFTDYTCPFCQRLHDSLGEINEAGVTVRYMMYPRILVRGEGERADRAVEMFGNAWCALDQKTAFDELFASQVAPPASCEDLPEDVERPGNPVYEHFMLGNIFDLRGTPLIVTEDGRTVTGFNDTRTLLDRLGI